MAKLEISRREMLALGCALLAGSAGGPGTVKASTALRPGVDPRLDWLLDAGFGLFLHWGPYAVAGVEASWPIMVPEMALKVPQPAISEDDYVALAESFDPGDFVPRDWVGYARRAGMRYIVLTAKHHDGYCLFDAPGTDYKSTRGPSGRDFCAELAEACAAEDMHLGFYYSPPDMHHPGYRDTSRPVTENWTGQPDRPQWAEYLDTMQAHLEKLLGDYGDVAVVWFDGLFDHDRYEPERFHRLIREASPATLVNDRLGPGDFITPEQTVLDGIPIRRQTESPLDEATFLRVIELLSSDLPEEQIAAIFAAGFKASHPTKPSPGPGEYQPWETCMTMNRTWGHVPTDTAWKGPETLVRTLLDARSRGGNLLLNVGPTGDGTFPPEAVSRLEDIGRWMEHHGEAVHDVTFGRVQGRPELRSTRSEDADYLALTDVREGSLRLDAWDPAATTVERLGDGLGVVFRKAGEGVVIDLPEPSDRWIDVLAARRRSG